MPYGLYLSAEGAVAQSRRMEVLANNLANVDSTGFKRQLAIFQARHAEATERGLDYHGSGSINDLGGGITVRETKTDFSRGTLRPTGLDTDVAIDGNAFFLVQKGNDTLLTRAGNFMLTSTGQLVTQQGYPVLDSGRAPIFIAPEQGPWSMADDGTILQQGEQTPLALVEPVDLAELEHAGENLFRLPPGGQAIDVAAEQRRVRSGYLEQSGVQPTVEMMELIECSRAFEANTSMIKNQDQMLGTLVGRALRMN